MSDHNPEREPRTDGGVATYSADVEPRTNRHGDRVDTRVAEVTDALAEVLGIVNEGDTLTVEYRTDEMTVTECGSVTKVEPEDTDIWFSDGAYLHVNTYTGDYYFQHSARESPPEGYEVQSITLRKRGDA